MRYIPVGKGHCMDNKNHYCGAGVLAAQTPRAVVAPQGGALDTLEQGQDSLERAQGSDPFVKILSWRWKDVPGPHCLYLVSRPEQRAQIKIQQTPSQYKKTSSFFMSDNKVLFSNFFFWF